jgi:YidC/Oxa1 family membrane protein insertase
VAGNSANVPGRLPAGGVAETTLVSTGKARIRLSNVGGTLIGAEFTDFHRLSADSSPVELAPRGEPLLGFRLVTGHDTIAVDRVALHRQAGTAPNEIAYQGDAQGIPVSVRWSFAPDTYHVKIKGGPAGVGYVSRVSVRASGIPAGGYLLADLPTGFRSSESDTAGDFRHLAYAFKPQNSGADLVRFGKPDPGERSIHRGPLLWAVAKTKYFLVGILATDSASRFTELDVDGVAKTSKIATRGKATVLVPLRDGGATLEVYVGPQEFRRMVAMGREFESANPYGGWMQGIIQPVATIVIRVLLWMRDQLHSYGLTLIIFGVAIRVVLWPLNQIAMRSGIKMQRIQPELAEAQKKYANDRDKQQQELMRIYREHGMSPFSTLSGCLPMLIPMPVLFALFFVFQNTIEFRGVSFWWMADISQKDPRFILPVVMAASMLLSSWIGQRNTPPNPQAKMMMYFLPALMLVFLGNFAAGLNLYYAAQNLATIPQQWLIANERAKATPRSS